jgi:hypothetical protein
MKLTNRFMFYMVVVIAAILASALAGCKTAVPKSVGITTGVTMNQAALKEKGALMTYKDNPNWVQPSDVVGIDENSLTLLVLSGVDGKPIGNIKFAFSLYKVENVVFAFVSGPMVKKPSGLIDFENRKEEIKPFNLSYLKSLYMTTKRISVMLSVLPNGDVEHVLRVAVES